MGAMLNALLGILVWFFVGCGVLAAIDDKEQRLFKWAKDCPVPLGYELTIMAWPVILWFRWREHD